MKLTVGPLPAAVYWRRRVAVVGALLLLVVALSYSCSGNTDASQRNRMLTPSAASSPTTAPSLSPSVLASASQPVLTPGGGIVAQAGDGGDSQTPSSSATAAPPPSPSGPCTDAEMSVVVVPEKTSAARGTYIKFTLRIKNVSNRSCTRDVGADPQEIYLQDAAKRKVWSSDTCDARHGTDVRTFGPGIETEFWQVWDGNANAAGCTKPQLPAPGPYELVGRLATKLSDPAPLVLK